MKLRISSDQSVSENVRAARSHLRKAGRKFAGLRFIDADVNETPDVFPAGSRQIKTVLANLDKQPRIATDIASFHVFTNYNDEVVVKQIVKLPFFHLV